MNTSKTRFWLYALTGSAVYVVVVAGGFLLLGPWYVLVSVVTFSVVYGACAASKVEE